MENKICYRGTDGDLQPLLRKLIDDKFGYPNFCYDENGKEEQMFNNTHFRTKDEAWKSITYSVKAAVLINGRNLIRQREIMKKYESEAIKSLEELMKVKDNADNQYSYEIL